MHRGARDGGSAGTSSGDRGDRGTAAGKVLLQAAFSGSKQRDRHEIRTAASELPPALARHESQCRGPPPTPLAPITRAAAWDAAHRASDPTRRTGNVRWSVLRWALRRSTVSVLPISCQSLPPAPAARAETGHVTAATSYLRTAPLGVVASGTVTWRAVGSVT